MKNILVYHVEVSEYEELHHVKYIPDSLKSLQSLVGGHLEYVVPMGLPPGIDMWINEEGRILNMPMHNNPFYHSPICGNWFLARHSNDGDTVSLTMEDIAVIIVKMKFYMGDI